MYTKTIKESYMHGGLLLALVKLLQLKVLANSCVEEGHPTHLPTLHPHMLHHVDGLRARSEREEVKAIADLFEANRRHI